MKMLNLMHKFKGIIAIDGLAASGKGLLAGLLAEHYGCDFLPTGNLYRVVAKKLIENKIDIDSFVQHPDDKILELIKAQMSQEDLASPSLASEELSRGSSKVGTVSAVRQMLSVFQKHWAAKRSLAILEGRDIGTVIFPNADVKLFLTADLKVRAARRTKDLRLLGQDITEDAVHDSLLEREQRDMNRKDSPLRKAADAVTLDTTDLSTDQMLADAVAIIEKKIDKA